MAKSHHMKSHKGLAKRIKLTAKKKVKFGRPGKNHINSHMEGGILRDKRRKLVVKKGDRKLLEKMLHHRITPSNRGPTVEEVAAEKAA